MNLKTRKVDLGVRNCPGSHPGSFQFIDLVVSSLVSEFLARLTRSGRCWAAVTSLGRVGGSSAHRSWRLGSAQEKLFLTQACSSNVSFLSGALSLQDRPQAPYETAKTEDLSSNFLSLQEIQMAYSKFKQLFLIGEKNPEPKLRCYLEKSVLHGSGERWCLVSGFLVVGHGYRGGCHRTGASYHGAGGPCHISSHHFPWALVPLPLLSKKHRATLLLSSFSSSERWASSSRSCGTMQYLYSSAVL